MIDATRRTLETELLTWMGEDPWQRDPARFERLALGLFAFQYSNCPPYSRFCDSLERAPGGVRTSDEIPAVPTGAFKEFDLRCFPAEETVLTFRTSGTATERRGQLHLDTLEVYEASLLASLQKAFLTDLVGIQPTLRFLAPSPLESPDSSLTHMFETLRIAEGSATSGYDLREGELDLESLSQAVSAAQQSASPLVVAGTSFAFVHFLDAIAADPALATKGRWRLPEGSRILETGGFKGRSREIPREVLRSELAGRFELAEERIINQYGMTELGSQFYDSTLLDPNGPRRKLIPPWTRVRLVDPESGRDVAPGEVGLIVIHDLANTGSIAALQTADLGRALLNGEGEMFGFDVLGREAGAEARGCSIAVDVMLEASRGGASE
jgi:hypothetical protein